MLNSLIDFSLNEFHRSRNIKYLLFIFWYKSMCTWLSAHVRPNRPQRLCVAEWQWYVCIYIYVCPCMNTYVCITYMFIQLRMSHLNKNWEKKLSTCHLRISVIRQWLPLSCCRCLWAQNNWVFTLDVFLCMVMCVYFVICMCWNTALDDLYFKSLF